MDETEVGRARRYEVQPRRLLALWGGTMILVGTVAAGLLVFTPLRTLIPGHEPEGLREKARRSALRVAALQDSMSMQREHIEQLRKLITGRIDSVSRRPSGPEGELATGVPTGGADTRPDVEPSLDAPADDLADVRPPVPSPVEGGFPTRRFDPQSNHYGVDVAVSEGTQIRAVGDGYVVLADWTREAGHTLAVQHTGGYLSVYKHNNQLLKEVGDRVRAREVVAVSGNTGEVTTGPHVHFELWRYGRPLDPRSYVADW